MGGARADEGAWPTTAAPGDAPLAEQFVRALESFDAEALTRLLADDAVAWRNVGNRTRSASEITASLAHERELLRSSELRVRYQSSTEDGFVVQVVLEGVTRGGADLFVPICLVAHVADGRIHRFEEYTDAASMQPLVEEFLADRAAAESGMASTG